MFNEIHSRSNSRLFWYGLLAQLQIVIGIFLVVGGLVYAFSAWIFDSIQGQDITFKLIIAGVMFVLGIFIGFKGKSKEFNYKRKSGYLLYNE
jgi:hypothetical protein